MKTIKIGNSGQSVRLRLSWTERQMLATAIRYRVLRADYLGEWARGIMQMLLDRIEGRLPKFRNPIRKRIKSNAD